MSFFRFTVVGKFSEIAKWLRISRVSQPQKNPANLKGEFGDSCKSWDGLQILGKRLGVPKKQKLVPKKCYHLVGLARSVGFSSLFLRRAAIISLVALTTLPVSKFSQPFA